MKYARPTSTCLQRVFGRVLVVLWRAIFESPMAGKLEVVSQLMMREGFVVNALSKMSMQVSREGECLVTRTGMVSN